MKLLTPLRAAAAEPGDNNLLLTRLHHPLIRIFHCNLQLWYADFSHFRVVCPQCHKGLLLVNRETPTYSLSRLDRCTICAQLFLYLDEAIAGNSFAYTVAEFDMRQALK